MKKYIQPATQVQQTSFIHSICVGSVQGGPLRYGGEDVGGSIDPM